MKTEDKLYEQIAQLRAKLYDAEFALLRCKNHAKAYKDNALPVSKSGFEEIEKIAEKAEKDLAQNSI
jgi:hypothetical protein